MVNKNMNKRGDIPTTILVIGVIVVCTLALVSFFLSTNQEEKNYFAGIGVIEQLDSQIEQNSFYQQIGVNQPAKSINDFFNYANQNTLENRKCNCGNSCDSYATFVSQSATKNGIPDPVLMLSIMMQESECNPNALSGSSVGLMQINLIHCGNYGLSANRDECKNELINNPQLNIEVGAEILKDSYNTYNTGKTFQGCANRNILYTGWDAAVRGYNGWGCGKDASGNILYDQDNYVEEVMNRDRQLQSQTYLELTNTEGILWWTKNVLSFSVEYNGK